MMIHGDLSSELKKVKHLPGVVSLQSGWPSHFYAATFGLLDSQMSESQEKKINMHAIVSQFETSTHVQMIWVFSVYGPNEQNAYVQVI